jgi:hypothetical protein
MSQPELSKGYAGSVSLDDEEGVIRVVTHAVLGLWDVVNTLTRLRPVHWRGFRVTVFGSARTAPGAPVYEQVKQLAGELASLGCEIVTGGGPGLMQAANEGAALAAAEGRERSIGVRIQLELEQHTNPFVGQAFEHQTFFSRLHHFILLSNAFVVVPGGVGTTLEAMMVWQLLQVRQLHGVPLIMVGGMWREWLQWASTHMLGVDPPLADPIDMTIPRCVNSVDEAVAIVRKYHQQWVNDRSQKDGPAAGSAGDRPPGAR